MNYRPPEHIDFLRIKFNMDPFYSHKYHASSKAIDTGFATLKVVVVYTAFEVHFRFFAREMLRLSGSSALVWMTAYRNKWVTNNNYFIIIIILFYIIY